MSTSTLRGVILAAAVVLGVVGLTKAFPQGGSPVAIPTTTVPSTTPGPSASPPVSPSPSTKPRVHGVRVQVLNGSGVNLLALRETQKLRKVGYHMLTPGNANHTATTVIYYQAGFRPEAEAIRSRFFPAAEVRPATRTANSTADITVILGVNASPSPSP
jgi:LytR cell envelope-related transcriptional attenuator